MRFGASIKNIVIKYRLKLILKSALISGLITLAIIYSYSMIVDRNQIGLGQIIISKYPGITLLFAFLTLIIHIINLIRPQKKFAFKPKPESPFSRKSLKGLKKDIYKTYFKSEPEEYLLRKELAARWTDNMIPDKRFILIHGPSQVGKTREAVELIGRINTYRNHDEDYENIYFLYRPYEVPLSWPADSPAKDYILFIDELLPDRPKANKEESSPGDSAVDRLKRIIDFLESPGQLRYVIITMLTSDYREFRSEFEDQFSQSNWEVFELSDMSEENRWTYIKYLAGLYKMQIEFSNIRYLVDHSTQALRNIYEFFALRKNLKKLSYNEINAFVTMQRNDWMDNLYNKLSPDQKLLYKSALILDKLQIPILCPVLVRMSILNSNRGAWLKRWILWRALRRMGRSYVRITNNYISIPEADFLQDLIAGVDLRTTLLSICNIAEELSAKPKYQSGIYYALYGCTRALFTMREFKMAISMNRRILDLPAVINSPDSSRIRSEILFRTGHCHFASGASWKLVEDFYIKAIALYPLNNYARHALATIYIKKRKPEKALDQIYSILETNKHDLIALKTELEIYIGNIDIYYELGIEKYIKCRLIIDQLKGDEKLTGKALSLQLACIRFLVAAGERTRETGELTKATKYFNRADRHFTGLLATVPDTEKIVEAVIRNNYGCFLSDTLRQTNKAIEQLKKACEANPSHEHSLHKLASILIDSGWEILRGDDYGLMLEDKANLAYAHSLLEKILNSENKPYPFPSLLQIAEIKNMSIDWTNYDNPDYWKNVEEVYAKFLDAIDHNYDSHPWLHNAMVHHSAARFLWHIEKLTYLRPVANRPYSLPFAEHEFEESLRIENNIDKDKLTFEIKMHLIKAYVTYTQYLLNRQPIKKIYWHWADNTIENAIDLSLELKIFAKLNIRHFKVLEKAMNLLVKRNRRDLAVQCFKNNMNNFNAETINAIRFYALNRLHLTV